MESGKGIFHLSGRQYAELSLYFGHQRVFVVKGILVGVCLNLELFCVVLRQDTHQQEGQQHQVPR